MGCRRGGFALVLLLLLSATAAVADVCPSQGVYLQVLGSGGPEVQDKRASSSYLVWVNGKARVLVDAGGGSALRFGESGANISDLRVVLFSHFHIDHSADFPALVKSSFFEGRKEDLPLYGPTGNQILPSASDFIDRLFNAENGVWPYLSDFLPSSDTWGYKLRPYNVDLAKRKPTVVFSSDELSAAAIPVHHGALPALAWKVTVADHTVVFSGDMNGDYKTLPLLAKNTDILVAHNAVPEGARGVAANLHMPPSVIGQIAGKAGVKKLVLSHRMLRTLGREEETKKMIRKSYSGPVSFADDLSCYALNQ